MILIEVLERRQLLAAQYSLTILPAATGDSSSDAFAINDSGKVVGFSSGSKGDIATEWSGSTATALPASPDGDKRAIGINSTGTVLYAHDVRSSGGTFASLNIFPLVDGAANAINDNGDVAGFFGDQATIWKADKTTVTIPTGNTSVAYDINNDGDVVGSSGSSDGTIPLLYANKTLIALPIPASDHPMAEAMTINNAGDVAGYYTTAKGVEHAVMWKSSFMVDLGQLDGSDYSVPATMNDSDQIVGYGNNGAFLYSGGVMHDLNALVNLPAGTTLTAAWSINNHGQIIGEASTPSGTRGFILSTLTTATISGTVFNDADVSGAKGSTEKALPSTKVYIDANKNGVLDTGEITAVADSSGNYKFGSLPAGAYRIRQASLSGYRITTTTSGYFDVTVASGQNVAGKNFGDTQKVLISGNAWKDVNGDGLKNTGDSGLSGWRVFIDTNKNGVFDTGENSVLTDASGNYTFKTLAAGTYRVREIAPAGWRRTAPSSGYFDLTVASGATVSGKNFGNTQNVLISGSVFNDLDKDGIKDSTEKGLSAWRVYIDTDKDGVFDPAEPNVLTDSSGNFTFHALPAGTYVLRVVPASGWTRATPSSGSFTITLSAAGIASAKNFGFAQNPPPPPPAK